MPFFRTSSLSSRLMNKSLKHTIDIVILLSPFFSQQVDRVENSFWDYSFDDDSPDYGERTNQNTDKMLIHGQRDKF